jgi:hypothetical protein
MTIVGVPPPHIMIIVLMMVNHFIYTMKVISSGTSVDPLLSEFPDLIRPTGVQREVRHNIVSTDRVKPAYIFNEADSRHHHLHIL